MIIRYSQIQRTDNFSKHNSVIFLVWPNNSVFIYELSGCGFDSRCSHVNFRSYARFEQRLPWHWSNYRMWIHPETRRWHDNKIQSNAVCRQVLKRQLNHLAKWLDVCLGSKWLWIQVPLESVNFQILQLVQKRSPWHSSNFKVWIHSETSKWHFNNIQSNALYRYILISQLNHLASLAKYFSVRLRTKWSWFLVSLQSLKSQIFYFFQASTYLIFK